LTSSRKPTGQIEEEEERCLSRNTHKTSAAGREQNASKQLFSLDNKAKFAIISKFFLLTHYYLKFMINIYFM